MLPIQEPEVYRKSPEDSHHKKLKKADQKEMNKKKANYRTDVWLPKNNFLVGLGSVLNIAGAYFNYNYSKSEKDADYKAMYSDWKNVGEDFKVSKKKNKKDNKDKLCLNF